MRNSEFGFNYYGTIGTNRDEIVVVRKMGKVDWLDTPATTEPLSMRNGLSNFREMRDESTRSNRRWF
jgi:hypothetical protein